MKGIRSRYFRGPPPQTDDADLSDIDLPPRTKGALQEAGIGTVSELAGWTEEELLELDGVAAGGVEAVRQALSERGYSLNS